MVFHRPSACIPILDVPLLDLYIQTRVEAKILGDKRLSGWRLRPGSLQHGCLDCQLYWNDKVIAFAFRAHPHSRTGGQHRRALRVQVCQDIWYCELRAVPHSNDSAGRYPYHNLAAARTSPPQSIPGRPRRTVCAPAVLLLPAEKACGRVK